MSLLLSIGLAGCAAGGMLLADLPSPPRDADQAKSENLVIQEVVCPTCNSNSRFAQKIQIGEVQGGREPGELPVRGVNPHVEVPNEAFRSALEQSLRNNGLLAEDTSHARLILNTYIIFTAQPPGGFKLTVYSKIRYVLRDNLTGEQVRDELVETKFTAKFSDSILVRTRKVKAVEGSIRDSIRQFVVRLLTEFKPLTIKSFGKLLIVRCGSKADSEGCPQLRPLLGGGLN